MFSTKSAKPIAAALFLAGLGAVLSGCPYGFSSSLLPAHIKTVGVPLFENRTERGVLNTALADTLTNAFIDDNTLKVVAPEEADSVVEGAFLLYRRQPFTVDANEVVQEYKVEIVVEARYVDVRKNKVIWEERLSQWATYRFTPSPTEPAETEEVGIGRVLLLLKNDILNRTVEGW